MGTTIVLRGGAEQFIAETERSLHDALMVVKRTVEHASVVGGGGAIEMELSKHLRDYSQTVDTKQQLIIKAFAMAFEVIPRQIADNAGLTPQISLTIFVLHTIKVKSGMVSTLTT